METSNWSLGAKYVKKINKTETPGSPAVLVKTKKKRKRKKLPKNYDPNVDPDPERWLPRWQRSTYKKKKDKRAKDKDKVGRGTQGAVGGLEKLVVQLLNVYIDVYLKLVICLVQNHLRSRVRSMPLIHPSKDPRVNNELHRRKRKKVDLSIPNNNLCDDKIYITSHLVY